MRVTHSTVSIFIIIMTIKYILDYDIIMYKKFHYGIMIYLFNSLVYYKIMHDEKTAYSQNTIQY